jgi:hypothetical protein
MGALFGSLALSSFADEAATPASEANPEIPSCRCAADASANTRQILEVLSQPLKSSGLEFTEEPLENVANFLQGEYGIPILLDGRAIEGAGMTLDEPMSVRIQNVSLRSALRLLLESKKLVYMVRNEVLYITTPEAADADLLTCVYDIRDLNIFLVRPVKNGPPEPDYDSLIDAIISCVAPETWAEAGGGEAEIRPVPPGMLVISQTRMVHDDIAALLATIRETLRLPAPRSQVQPAEGAMGMGMEEGSMEGMGRGMMVDPESTAEPTPADEDMFD